MREIIDIMTGHYGLLPPASGPGGTKFGANFKRAVLSGLRQPCKELPGKYFFDRRGGELFDALSPPSGFHGAQVELALLKACSRSLAEFIGEGATLVELGGADSPRARVLLGALKNPVVYMPIDFLTQRMWTGAMQLQLDHPYLAVRPLNADFTILEALPADGPWVRELTTFMLLGSAFDRFDPISAVKLLKRLSRLVKRSLMIIGVALKQEPRLMAAACNEGAGCAAEFNLNLLLLINRELDGDFDVAAFEHQAIYNETVSRVEMQLKSRRRQTVHFAGESVSLEKGELINTSNSYRYNVGQIHRLVRRANYIPVKTWIDPERVFSLNLLSSDGIVA